MPRKTITKKTTPKKTAKAAPKKVAVEKKPEVIKEVVESPKVVSLPTYDGLQVERILEDGRDTVSHFHCLMEGGSTMHVPRELFK